MKSSPWLLRALLCTLTLSLLSVALHAAPIDFSILNPNIIGAPGGSFTFQGTITNNSGFDLQSTDFFFNFFGFDPLNVTLTQLLGNTVFDIPNGKSTGVVDLFQTIRQDGFSSFSAMGYGISTVNGSMQSDVRWVVFGRSCD